MIDRETIERSRATIKYLRDKRTLNPQESFDMQGALITLLISITEHLEARINVLEAKLGIGNE